MKKALFALAMIACACALFAVPKIAVLSPAIDKAITDDVASPIVDKLLEELLKSRKYNIVDRSSRDVIWEERNFQLSSGEIDQKEIKTIGQGLGADYVVVVKVKKIGTLYSMSTTMINVETLEVIAQASSEAKASVENLLQLAKYCGAQLVASVTGKNAPVDEPDFSEGGDEGDTAATAKLSNGSKLGDEDYYTLKNDLRVLLQQKVFLKSSGQDRIAAKAGALTASDRHGLYEEYSKQSGVSVLAMFLNMIPFIKVGSFIQGDSGGAWTFGLLELGSILLIPIGYDVIDSEDVATTGSVLFTVFYIWSWFQPYGYAKGWNKKLSRSLNIVASVGPRDPKIRITESPGGGYGTRLDATLVSFSY